MRLRTAAATVFATAILLGGAASTASAQEHDIELPAGVACDFAFGLDGGAFPPRAKDFYGPEREPDRSSAACGEERCGDLYEPRHG